MAPLKEFSLNGMSPDRRAESLGDPTNILSELAIRGVDIDWLTT